MLKLYTSLSSIIFLMLWQHCIYDPVRLTQTQNRLEVSEKNIQWLHTNVVTVFTYGNCLGSHVWCNSINVPSTGRFDIQVIIMLYEPDMTQIVDISILGVVEIGNTESKYLQLVCNYSTCSWLHSVTCCSLLWDLTFLVFLHPSIHCSQLLVIRLMDY